MTAPETNHGKLLPLTFLILFALLSVGVVATSQSLWGTPPDPASAVSWIGS